MSDEPFRPSYHFAPARNWLNDPNGLVWHDGEYHLFFQHNPYGTDWGNMSWGHAVSPDLVHWRELPVALESTDTEHVFSGSVVVDHTNSSALGTGGEPAMVALYTSHDPAGGRQAQSVAYSLDRGRTWQRHPANPVLDIGAADFRDPKVFRYAPDDCWIMVVVLAADRVVQVYRSADLLTWEHLSDFGPAGPDTGIWECPDLFPLPLDGDPTRTRWVMVVSVQEGAPAGGSGMQYFVGDFDGERFVPDSTGSQPDGAEWLDHGADYYAAVSFSGLPGPERLLLGWMSNWDYARAVPTKAFRGSMSLPRRCELRTVGDRVRLVQRPVPPPLGDLLLDLRNVLLAEGEQSLPVDGTGLAVELEIELGTARSAGIHVRVGAGERTVVGYDAGAGCVFLDRSHAGASAFGEGFSARHRAPYTLIDGLVRLTVLVDSASVEVFAGDGEVAITDQVFPAEGSTGVALFTEGGTATVRRLRTWAVQAARVSPAG